MTRDVATLAEVLKSNIGYLEEEVGLLKQARGSTSHLEDGTLTVKVSESKA